MSPFTESVIEEDLFITGMWWRIVYGAVRVIFGLSLLRVIGMPLLDIFSKLMSHELIEEPGDLLVNFTRNFLTHHPLQITYFLASYFIFWGLVDMVLSYNLIKHRLWAFPVSMVLVSLFIIYELVRVTHTHSLLLLWIIFVDMVILLLIGREYAKLKKQS